MKNLALTETIAHLNRKYDNNYPINQEQGSQETGYIPYYLMKMIVREHIESVYGKGYNKANFQNYYNATMQNTKYDYFNQIGVLKPC